MTGYLLSRMVVDALGYPSMPDRNNKEKAQIAWHFSRQQHKHIGQRMRHHRMSLRLTNNNTLMIARLEIQCVPCARTVQEGS